MWFKRPKMHISQLEWLHLACRGWRVDSLTISTGKSVWAARQDGLEHIKSDCVTFYTKAQVINTGESWITSRLCVLSDCYRRQSPLGFFFFCWPAEPVRVYHLGIYALKVPAWTIWLRADVFGHYIWDRCTLPWRRAGRLIDYLIDIGIRWDVMRL